MNEERETGGTTTADAGADGTLADVSHVHPDTAETFWAVYRRGPAVADGGVRRARRNASGPAASADDGPTGDASPAGPDRPADDGGSTMADVNHEPPYPEPKGIWTRGPARAGGGTDDEDPDVSGEGGADA